MVCNSCGTHLYPPTEVSDMGIEDYEEVFEAPPVKPDHVPTDEELAEINRERREAGLTEFKSADDWVAYYKDWATKFREDRRGEAQARYGELGGEPPKLRDLAIVEEDRAFKVKGKRWKAAYEETPTGWRLRCVNCNAVLLEWSRGG
jgi:hypothetical protein